MLSAGSKVVTGLASDRDQAAFGGVFVLAVAPASSVEIPAVLLDGFDDFADCHARGRWQSAAAQSIRRVPPAVARCWGAHTSSDLLAAPQSLRRTANQSRKNAARFRAVGVFHEGAENHTRGRVCSPACGRHSA